MSIFVLKSKGIEPMLVGDLGFTHREGIYIEVDEENIPKKYRIDKLGGAAVVNEYCMRSATHGITFGKYFKKIHEPLDFEPIEKEKLELLEDESIRYDWNEVAAILEDINKDALYSLNFEYRGEYFEMMLERRFIDSEIKVVESEFMEYDINFRGMYSFAIKIPFSFLSREQIEEIKNLYGDKHGYIRRINLDIVDNIVSRYNLNITKDEIYYHRYYSKSRTNFYGKDTKGINVYDKNINKIMTFSEATSRWNLADSTLRKLVTTDKIKENVDYRKSGKVWLITEEAMIKIYGEPQSE